MMRVELLAQRLIRKNLCVLCILSIMGSLQRELNRKVEGSHLYFTKIIVASVWKRDWQGSATATSTKDSLTSDLLF